MRVLWLDRAQADLDEIFDYLLDHDPSAALRMRSVIRDRVGRLADYPGLGRPGRIPGTRDLVIGGTPYLVAYIVDHRIEAVIILRVLHGARLWPDDLKPS